MLLLLKKGRYARTGPKTVEAAAISQVTSQQGVRDVENARLTATLLLTLLSKRTTLCSSTFRILALTIRVLHSLPTLLLLFMEQAPGLCPDGPPVEKAGKSRPNLNHAGTAIVQLIHRFLPRTSDSRSTIHNTSPKA